MDSPIQVDEIGLRIAEKAWRGNAGFVDFVTQPDNLGLLFPEASKAEISGEEHAHNIAIEILNRFWASDRACTVIVSNISLSYKREYLLHPPAEGAVTAGYGTDEGIPGFRCLLRNGFFLAVGFEAGYRSEELGADELVLLGRVYAQIPPAPGQPLEKTRPPRSLPEQVVHIISTLKSKRAIVERNVSGWLECLGWLMDLVRSRQFGLLYNAVEIDGLNYCLRFAIFATAAQLETISNMKSFHMAAMPLSASKNSNHWEPVEDARGTSLGDFLPPKKQIKRLLSAQNNTDALLQDVFEITVDPHIWDKTWNAVPSQGFLVNEVYQSLIPYKRQREGLQQLIKGEVVNPRLADFLFDITKARLPDVPVFGLDEADSAHIRDIAPDLKLNNEQKLAIAKALATPDLFLLQGPPGTGKTIVLALICVLKITRSERVLISSQSNVAVDKVLDCLPNRPEIRPLRIGRKEEQSKFSEKQVIDTYLSSSVHDACEKAFAEEQKLAEDIEEIELLWPQFTDIVSRYDELIEKRAATEKQISTTEKKLAKLTDKIAELKRQHSIYLSGLDALAQALKQLDSDSTVTDTAEWVKLIDPADRFAVFTPLKTWQQDNSLPETVQKLLAAQQPDDNSEEQTGSGSRSWGKNLLRWFRRQFERKRRKIQKSEEIQPTGAEIEPNWAVVWINAISLLNRLRGLGAILPQLLESCTELERLCAATVVSKVSEAGWSKTTRQLHHILKSSEKTIAPALTLDDIATSLQPKKRFSSRLSKTRLILQNASVDISPYISKLQKTLARVAEASVTHTNNLLAKTNKRVQRIQSSISSKKCQQNELIQALASINAQLSQLESAWAETFNLLPLIFKTRIDDAPPQISHEGLDILARARECLRQETQERLDYYRLWSPIKRRWLKLLEHTTKADKSMLLPLYRRCCNIVGVTCSWARNSREFLSRDECLNFDTVIIDEVSKAMPPELIMPALRGKRLILSGDHRQLPPVFKEGRHLERTFNELAEIDPEFEKFLRFKTVVTASHFRKLYHESPDVLKQHFVKVHRFPPQVLELIKQFYYEPLECDISDSNERFDHKLRIMTESGEFLSRQNHIIWVDTSRDLRGRWVRERQVGTGKANDIEADVVSRLVKLLNQAAGQAGKKAELAVITFYGQQVRCIRDRLARLNANDKKFLQIRLSTVDDFQGLESEIAIVSLVRSKRGRIGPFARQYERVNVAMSRGQRLLIIVGSVETFTRIDVPLPMANGRTVKRKSYANIVDIVKKYGGMRTLRDLL